MAILNLYVSSLNLSDRAFSIFSDRYAHIARISPAIMDTLYTELTHDQSSSQRDKLMEQRIQMALQGEPGITTDLRTLNSGRPGDSFNVFWEKMGQIVNEVCTSDRFPTL